MATLLASAQISGTCRKWLSIHQRKQVILAPI